MEAETPDTAVKHLLALKAAPSLSSLPPDDLALLVERARLRALDAGEVLLAEGAPATSVYLVVEGRLAEQRYGAPWAIREPYELVGEVDALAGAGEHIMLRAEGPTQTLEITREDLLEVCADRFAVLATVGTAAAALALAARRRLGPTAGFAPAQAVAGSRLGATRHLDLAERVALLREIPTLAATPIQTLAYVMADSVQETTEAGHALWQAGDQADHLLLIVSGLVLCTSADGTQRFNLGPGDVVGALDALAAVPRWYAATARTAVIGLRTRTADLLDVLEDDPETAVEALTRFACAVSTLVERVARADLDT